MKKITLLSICLAVLFMSGCATFNKEYLKTVNQVALVSVITDKRIDMTDFSGLAAVLSKEFQGSQFNLQPVCTEIKNNLFTKNVEKFPFQLLPEKRVINSAGYKQLKQEFDNKFANYLYHEVPKGYTVVRYTNDADLEKVFRLLPESDGTMVVVATFKLKKLGEFLGFGSADLRTYLAVVVKNRQNKDVIKKIFLGKSQHKIKYSLGGIFDATDVQPLCLEATQDALYQFDKWVKSNL
jgi:hypothetical protein